MAAAIERVRAAKSAKADTIGVPGLAAVRSGEVGGAEVRSEMEEDAGALTTPASRLKTPHPARVRIEPTHLLPTLTGTDNDWGTRCDLIINPGGVETGTECDTPPPPTEWTNESVGAMGVAAGFAAGYRFGRYRAQVEYRYRATSHHDYTATQIGDVVTAQKADQELETAIGGAGDITVHGVFTDFAVDLLTTSRGIASYVGVGAGVQRMAVDYFSLWKRNDDPTRITTFVDGAMRAKLAGTTRARQDAAGTGPRAATPRTSCVPPNRDCRTHR